jgi:triacylglycerol lipase
MRWLSSRVCIARVNAHYRGNIYLCQQKRWKSEIGTQNNNKANPPTSSEEENPIHAGDLDVYGTVIKDEYAQLREKYATPKLPIVLAHGLMGFDELRLAGRFLPGIEYWRGISGAMRKNGIEVITTSVPTTGSIQERAEALHEQLKDKLHQMGDAKEVNIIAHSMGGLDSRYLISTIKPKEYSVKSLTTIATPHRGSSAADWILREIGYDHLPGLYKILSRLRINSGAFSQLTRKYVTEEFNTANLDDPNVRYFSYGASAKPNIFSAFRFSHDIMLEIEGPNDGLVSVASSKWGSEKDSYKGTLIGVTHLDLINWTNRLKRLAASLTLMKEDFNAIAFYLAIADMLAKEGM